MATAPRPTAPLDARVGTGASADLLELLALFLRTVAIYPDGHNRVVAVADRFREAIADRRAPAVLEVTTAGLRVDGADRDGLAAGPKALRDALLATGVARVSIDPDVSGDVSVRFARCLQANVRRAQGGGVSFGDLWPEPLPGIALVEQAFGVEAFAADADAAAPPSQVVARHGTGAAAGDRAADDRVADDRVAGDRVAGDRRPARVGAATAARAGHDAARSLREAALRDAEVRDALAAVEELLLATGSATDAASAGGGADVLEHVLRGLPIEARLDPRRGVPLLRTVLERLARAVEDEARGREVTAEADAPAAALVRALQHVFPDRPDDFARFVAAPASSGAVDRARRPEAADDGIDDATWLGDADLSDHADDPLDDADGILDLAGLLTHALLVEPSALRRETLRRRLVEVLRERPAIARPPCVLRHLKEALAVPAERRSSSEVALLAGVVEEAALGSGLVVGGGLDPEDVVRAFPRLLRTFVLAGGSAGFVARRVGREAVLGAHVTLLAAGGLLHGGDLLDRLLDDRDPAVLPFLEVLVETKDPTLRARVAASLRRRELPSRAAAALRVVPDERVSPFLLHVLCEDGFRGTDSRRGDATAVAEIGAVARDRSADAGVRAYAVAALVAFPRDIAERAVRPLVGRGWFDFSTPRAVRRAARAAVRRWDAEDAVDRAVAPGAAAVEAAVAPSVFGAPTAPPEPAAAPSAPPAAPSADGVADAVADEVSAAFERLGIDEHLCPPTTEPGSLA